MLIQKLNVVIEYCAEGVPVSDFNYSDWLYEVLHTTEDYKVFKVSTSISVDAIRLAIVKGEISHTNVTFMYFGNPFQANEYGAINNWPSGFCDKGLAMTADILTLAIKKRKNKA